VDDDEWSYVPFEEIITPYTDYDVIEELRRKRK